MKELPSSSQPDGEEIKAAKALEQRVTKLGDTMIDKTDELDAAEELFRKKNMSPLTRTVAEDVIQATEQASETRTDFVWTKTLKDKLEIPSTAKEQFLQAVSEAQKDERLIEPQKTKIGDSLEEQVMAERPPHVELTARVEERITRMIHTKNKINEAIQALRDSNPSRETETAVNDLLDAYRTFEKDKTDIAWLGAIKEETLQGEPSSVQDRAFITIWDRKEGLKSDPNEA